MKHFTTETKETTIMTGNHDDDDDDDRFGVQQICIEKGLVQGGYLILDVGRSYCTLFNLLVH